MTWGDTSPFPSFRAALNLQLSLQWGFYLGNLLKEGTAFPPWARLEPAGMGGLGGMLEIFGGMKKALDRSVLHLEARCPGLAKPGLCT